MKKTKHFYHKLLSTISVMAILTTQILFGIEHFIFSAQAEAYSQGDVLINEFLINPSSGNEWFELMNTTNNDIDLASWKLNTALFGDMTISVLKGSESTILPAYGLLTIDLGSNPANDAGDVLQIKDPTNQAIHAVSYGDQAIPPAPNHVDAPGSGQSALLESETWSVGVSTKGWFNNATDWTCEQLDGVGTPSNPPTLSSITTCLSSEEGVVTNMGSLENPSVVTGLYFEKRTDVGNAATALGKIAFTDTFNLTDQNTVEYLKSIGNKLNMEASGGDFSKIGLNTYITGTTESDFKTAAATVTMYGLTDYSDTPDLVIKDNDGVIIAPTDPDYPSLTNATFNDGANTFTFDTDHFTTFETNIPVTNITVSGEESATTITTNNGTLQMSVDVLPANATDPTVTWSVTPGTGTASVSDSGLLSALTNGTVTVTATANDGSSVTDTEEITISGTTVPLI